MFTRNQESLLLLSALSTDTERRFCTNKLLHHAFRASQADITIRKLSLNDRCSAEQSRSAGIARIL
jgi:hypothetical protein